MSRLIIYSTASCPICKTSKELLHKWNIAYTEKRVDQDRGALKEMMQISNGARMVPQFSIDGKWIGGFSDLTEWHMDGKLDDLVT